MEDHLKEKADEHKSQTSAEANRQSVDRFTKFMFGEKRHSNEHDINVSRDTHSTDHNDQTDEINYFTIMEQINDIMVSLENLKPMLKELSPIMDYIKKKI